MFNSFNKNVYKNHSRKQSSNCWIFIQLVICTIQLKLYILLSVCYSLKIVLNGCKCLTFKYMELFKKIKVKFFV